MALPPALSGGRAPVHVLLDNRYVVDKVTSIKAGVLKVAAHNDVWVTIPDCVGCLLDIAWINTHVTIEEANRRDYHPEQHSAKVRAHTMAGKGNGQHQGGPGQVSLFEKTQLRRYPLEMLTRLRCSCMG